ncbi:hypothetical protein Pse7367_3188 [Thalassoporum mexicanum PCC 7367]|nr:hypothetical protein Pse7367_3188 [Pseudanabaena sp. PCC 7367]
MKSFWAFIFFSIMTRFHLLFQKLSKNFPVLEKLFSVGWKVVLTEILIEIPFMILESSFLIRFLFGVTLGLTFWQYIVIASTLYLLIEFGRWAFVRFISKSNDYRFWKHELEMLQILLNWLKRLRRKTKDKLLEKQEEN